MGSFQLVRVRHTESHKHKSIIVNHHNARFQLVRVRHTESLLGDYLFVDLWDGFQLVRVRHTESLTSNDPANHPRTSMFPTSPC